jgi:hypothetical protein
VVDLPNTILFSHKEENPVCKKMQRTGDNNDKGNKPFMDNITFSLMWNLGGEDDIKLKEGTIRAEKRGRRQRG